MDVSLYELAVSTEPSPQPMPVSPATLLSLVGSVIDLLIEQQISARLWVKPPPGQMWQAQIQRYHEQVGVSHAIYTCSLHDETPAAVTGIASQYQDSPQTGRGESYIDPYPVVSVQMAPSLHLRREYFLLVLSPQFCSIILAYRPRVRRQNGAIEKANQKETQPRQLAVCSFEGRVIQRVVDGIKQAITQSQSQSPLISDAPNSELLANWDSLFICPPEPDPVLLSQLLAKQIRCQEEIWQSATINRAASSLQLQYQELLNSLRLKDEFLSNVCQELRTPLTNMKTALSLLNSPQLKPAQRQRYLHLLNTECDRQSSLITGFLDLVQLDRVAEQTAWQPIRLCEIVPGVVSTYQPLAQEKGIMLAYTVPEDLPAVSCPSAWLKQIVINLLHNSIKFTPTGGQVWVRSRLQGDYVQLEFRDTGIGIPTSEIPKIFDRFYRVRPVAGEDAGGAGLGLTIVQQLLLRCGGSISVKSRIGQGSVFNVLLLIADLTAQESFSD